MLRLPFSVLEGGGYKKAASEGGATSWRGCSGTSGLGFSALYDLTKGGSYMHSLF